MKIFLVGLVGSGKTTLGRQLAEVLQVPFVDMDWEIEAREGRSISEIFSQNGEDYFRRIEAETLRDWAGSNKDFVMGTGGGAPCFYNGMDIINESGLSIFLDVPLDELNLRLAAATDRPLLHTTDDIERKKRLQIMHDARRPIYSKAHIILDNVTFENLLRAVRLKT
jgi:shikimate kinase